MKNKGNFGLLAIVLVAISMQSTANTGGAASTSGYAAVQAALSAEKAVTYVPSPDPTLIWGQTCYLDPANYKCASAGWGLTPTGAASNDVVPVGGAAGSGGSGGAGAGYNLGL